MDLPDESQWDETTCDQAVCQHPQCWATIRRIERGHPRILDSSCRTSLDAEDRLPMLSIVNIADSCFQGKRLARSHLSGFTFTKAHTLSQCSKFDSRFQGRPWKDLRDRDLINRTNRSPKVSQRLKKLSVLNLNETQLPCPRDVGNMDVIWIPEKHMSPAKKKHIICSQDGKMKRKKSTGKHKSSRVNTETQLGPPGMIVPPPSPVHLFEQLSSESLPLWNQYDMLPQGLLKDLLLDKGKNIPYPEIQTQLAMMKKKPPLEKSQPDSAISAKMYLSVHRLTLQTPALRYPEHLKKLYYNLTTEGYRKQQWQQQRKVKTAPRKQEAKKKSKSEPGSHNTSGHRTPPGQESDKKQQQQMKIESPTLKQDSTERPQMDCTKKNLDSFPSRNSPELSTIERTNMNIRTQMQILLGAQERTPKSALRTSWNPELKLLRILQATDEDDEENQPSGAQSEESLEA